MNEKNYNYATAFKQSKGGQPMYKDNAPILNKNGEMLLIPTYKCYLDINVPLPVGKYVIEFREKFSPNTGELYLSGGIKVNQNPKHYDHNKNYNR